MVPFPSYNPNYEERRGRYSPAEGQNRTPDEPHTPGKRENTAMPAEGPVQEGRPDEQDGERFTEEA